jgi:hypothetical protein
MIQRIQTVYLLISVILLGLLFALPLAEVSHEGTIYLFNFKGIAVDGNIKQNGILISALITVLLALHGLAIAMFKARIKQMMVIKYAIVGLVGLLGIFFYFTSFRYNGAAISYKIGFIFPLIIIVLDWLAIRAIGKDEALIRSIDRIR